MDVCVGDLAILSVHDLTLVSHSSPQADTYICGTTRRCDHGGCCSIPIRYLHVIGNFGTMQVLFGKGLVTKYILTVLTSVSFKECQNECASRPMCGLALYQRSHVCELHMPMASRPENIVMVPGSTIVKDVEPIDTVCLQIQLHQ